MATGLISERNRLGVRNGTPTREVKFSAMGEPAENEARFTLHTLSHDGLLFQTDASFTTGEPISIVHPELEGISARIAWVGEGFVAGIFSRRLTASELGAIRLSVGAAEDTPRTADGVTSTQMDQTLGQRIQYYRHRKGYSKIHFASVIGVSKPTLSRWESDESLPSARTLRAIARELQISEIELVYGAADHSVLFSERVLSGDSYLTTKLSKNFDEIAEILEVDKSQLRILVC